MKLVFLLFLLVVICIATCIADTDQDSGSDLERSSREAVVGKRGATKKPAKKPANKPAHKPANKPQNNNAPRKPRFKTRKNKYPKEHYQRMLGFKRFPKKVRYPLEVDIVTALRKVYANTTIPTCFSWLNVSGIVGPVKNQRQCGDCYAFASICAFECMIAIWNKAPARDFSEQDVLDCSTKFGNLGCRGGMMENVFRYLAYKGGAEAEKACPYRAVKKVCSKIRKPRVGRPITFSNIDPGDEDAIRYMVYFLGPTTIALGANIESFLNYSTGIYDDPKCPTQLDHAVVVVGFCEDSNGTKYWIVRNSWGSDWGEGGYILIERGVGRCGIGQIATIPMFKPVSDALLAGKPVTPPLPLT